MVTSRNLSSCRAHTNSSVLYTSLLDLAIALQYHVEVERANSSAEDSNVMSLMRHPVRVGIPCRRTQRKT